MIKVEDPFITAIEVALGSAMQNVVTKDTDTAKSAINYLKENKFGRVTFMPLTTVQPHKINALKLNQVNMVLSLMQMNL